MVLYTNLSTEAPLPTCDRTSASSRASCPARAQTTRHAIVTRRRCATKCIAARQRSAQTSTRLQHSRSLVSLSSSCSPTTSQKRRYIQGRKPHLRIVLTPSVLEHEIKNTSKGYGSHASRLSTTGRLTSPPCPMWKRCAA